MSGVGVGDEGSVAARGAISGWIRPAVPEDVPRLYALAAQCGSTWSRVSFGATPPPELLWDVLEQDALISFVTEMPDQSLVAHAALHHASEALTRVHLEVVATPCPFSDQWRTELTAHCLDHAFGNFGFAKVVGVHHAFERSSLAMLPVRTMEEGRLRECYRHRGAYWDRVYTSITREAWSSSAELSA